MQRLIAIALILILWRLIDAPPHVLAQTPQGDNTPPPDFFVEAEIDISEPYVGQQVTYTLRRYQAIELPNSAHVDLQPFTGFIDTPLLQRPGYSTTVAGREYKVNPTHIALFPTGPGPATIQPARLIIPGNSSQNDLIIESMPIQLAVQPLPPNPPVEFKGAVGQFEISARLIPPEGEIEQPLTLIVDIAGTGNIATLPEPIIPTLDHWRTIGAAQSQTDINLSKERVSGRRRFQWPLVASQGGQQYFPAINFSYFDPDSGTYRHTRTDPISIVIYPLPAEQPTPPAPPGPLSDPRQEVRQLSNDIQPIKPVPASLRSADSLLTPRTPWIWSGTLLALLGVGGAWFLKRWRRHNLADTPPARRRRARQRANAILDHSQADTYARIQAALTSYLSDQLDHPATGLTSDQLLERLRTAGLPPPLADQTRDLLSRVETGRFAPLIDEATPSASLLAATRQLIADLETFFAK